MCSGKPMHASPTSEISPVWPGKQFQCWSDRWWSFLSLSRKIDECFLSRSLSPLGDQWCDVLGFVCVSAGSVSESSTLQNLIFWDIGVVSGSSTLQNYLLRCKPIVMVALPFSLICSIISCNAYLGQFLHDFFLCAYVLAIYQSKLQWSCGPFKCKRDKVSGNCWK